MAEVTPPVSSGASGVANPIIPAGLSMELPAAISGPSALTGTTPYPSAVAAVPVTPVQAHEVPSTEMNPPRRTMGPLNNPTFRGVGYHPQPSHDRHHSRRQGRKRQSQKSVASWMWLKLCCRIRKSTMEFFDAVDSGRVELVRDMIRASPALLLRTRPGTRWTAVHFTAERGEYATLTALFEEAQAHDERREAQSTISCARIKSVKKGELTKRMVNALTEKNLTPLMLACKRGHPSTATHLMSMGSNPCVADREGAKMAIHYACLYGHWSCAQVMMEPRWVVQNPGGLRPLAQAMITDMHGRNRYIDARTCAGLTPLHMAAWAGHVEVAKILLANGAYLNPKIVFSSPSTSSVLPGSTPTHLATRKNRIHVVKALLSAYMERKAAAERTGAHPEEDPRTIADDRGNYAIMHAIARGNNSMAALLDANADLETILATDLNQLGQVPKLQALAISALRSRLLLELEGLITTQQASGGKSITSAYNKAKQADADEMSQRSVILDGSPKSQHPASHLGGASQFGVMFNDPDLQSDPMNEHCLDSSGRCNPGGLQDVMGLEMSTNPLDEFGLSMRTGLPLSRSGSAESLCGICMEEPHSIELVRCGHCLCRNCARQLLAVAAASSCMCPFCRKYIGGFAVSGC